MRVVAVTGATGFVGSRVCERLIGDGWQVRRALRRASEAEGVVVGELGPQTDWSGVVAGVDAVVHLAARVHVMNDSATDPLAEFRRMNVEGTLNLARQAAAAGVRRFVYLSSIKVNGERTDCVGSAECRVLSAEKEKDSPEQENSSELKVLSAEKYKVKGEATGSPLHRIKCGAGSKTPMEEEGNKVRVFREDDVPDPQDAYAISKWEAEQGLMALAQETGMEVVIIRPPLVYGPGVKGNFASMLRWVEKGIPLPLGAVRNNRRSFVALDNLVDLIVTCLDHPAAANEVFLAGDGEDLSTTELLQRVARAMGKSAQLVPVPVWLLATAARLLGKQAVAQRLFGSLQVDISKAKEVLGWEPPVSVDEGLKAMLNYEL